MVISYEIYINLVYFHNGWHLNLKSRGKKCLLSRFKSKLTDLDEKLKLKEALYEKIVFFFFTRQKWTKLNNVYTHERKKSEESFFFYSLIRIFEEYFSYLSMRFEEIGEKNWLKKWKLLEIGQFRSFLFCDCWEIELAHLSHPSWSKYCWSIRKKGVPRDTLFAD